MAARHTIFDRRGDLHDLVILDVQRQRAADAAIGADRVGFGLLLFLPLAALAQLVFRGKHQRAGRADADAVPAVDAGRVGERNVVFGRNVGVKAAPRHGDGERVLRVRPAGFHALVAENAFVVVAHVEGVVDFDRLLHRLARRPYRADRRRSARKSVAHPARWRDRPTTRETRAPSCDCAARAANRCEPPCRFRPVARRREPARGSPRARRRKRGRR